MLLYGATSTRCSMILPARGFQPEQPPIINPNSLPSSRRAISAAISTVAAVALALSAGSIEAAAPPQSEETLSNIPQTLSSECTPEENCRKRYRIQKPKSRKAESCTGKCVTTCIQGGFGSPGEGPFNVRRPLVVFKESFRSRKYCLSECSEICNLIGDGDDGP